jgi:hypothetical protein
VLVERGRLVNVYPGTDVRPVAYSGLHARKPYRAALLHTNGGGAQLFGWWSQIAASGKHVGAHYQVFNDGRSECYTDPSLVVYHAYAASEWAIGIETEDDGDNSRPWTPEQIRTIAEILHHHQVPARMLTSPDPGDGVGYHQQFPAWNQNGHDCVGAVRRAQIPQVLAALETLYAPTPVQEDDMYAVVSDPRPGHSGEYGTNGVSKFPLPSQQAKNEWAAAFSAKRITLTPAAFEAIPTVGGA